MAVLAFFLLGHLFAKLSSFPADGFSSPYQWSVNVGMLFYFLIGFKALFEVLKDLYSLRVAFITLLMLYITTNLFQMSGDMLVHPHISLFSLTAMLIYYSSKWHQEATLKRSAILGVLLGLMILTRPTMAVMVMIPLCWNFQGYRTQLQNLISAKWHIVVAALIAIAIASLQFVYWKIATGSWFYFSYDNPGEGLDFYNPHILSFLFSFRKGWFIYTPLGLVMVYGIWVLYKENNRAFYAVGPIVLICVYIMSSWSTWYYAGGSFSSRTLVNIYPVLAIGLSAVINQVLIQERHVFWLVIIPMTILNLFQTWQWRNDIIDPSRMTMSYYLKIFGKTEVLPEWKEELLVYRSPETNPEIDLIHLYDTVGTIKTIVNFKSDTIINGMEMMALNEEFTPAFTKSFQKITDKDHAWLVVDGSVWRESLDYDLPSMVVHFSHNNGAYKYRSFTPPNSQKEKLVHYQYPYLSPEVRSSKDLFNTYWWNSKKANCYTTQVYVHVLERR